MGKLLPPDTALQWFLEELQCFLLPDCVVFVNGRWGGFAVDQQLTNRSLLKINISVKN